MGHVYNAYKLSLVSGLVDLYTTVDVNATRV